MKKKLQKAINDLDTKEILAKGFSFLVIRVSGLFMAYVFTYFVTQKYGASVFGLVSLCFSLFLFSSILGRLGLDVNLVRFYASEVNWNDKGLFYRVWLKSMVISLILGIALYFLKDIISNEVFGKPKLEPYIFWTAIAIPFWTSTLICAGLLRAKKKNNWFAFLNNPGRFTFTVLSFIVLGILIDTPLNAIKAHFFGLVILSILAFYLAARTLRTILFATDHSSWTFLKQSFPMMLSSTILIILGWSDTFVLGVYETDENVGIYNVALRIAALTSFTLQAINSILAPKLASYWQENKLGEVNKLVRFSTKLNFYITTCIILLIVLLNKQLLGIFGDVFKAGSSILFILCIGQMVNSISGPVGIILQMTGNQKPFQNIMLIALILNLVLNFVLTPIYGTIGAACATIASLIFWNVTGCIYLKRRLNLVSYYNPF